jgi:hypothetical protein
MVSGFTCWSSLLSLTFLVIAFEHANLFPGPSRATRHNLNYTPKFGFCGAGRCYGEEWN